MKMSKTKLLISMVSFAFILTTGVSSRTALFDFMDEGRVDLGQVKENETEHSSNVSDFTGENFSVLPKNERLTVSLKKHTDGDTTQFLLGDYKVKVRYLLIDTPETVKPNTKPQPFGHEASTRTKELLENADKIEIMLDSGDRTDHYKRVLAYVFVDGELVQNILISEGLARLAYVKEPNTSYLKQLTAAEEQAKRSKIGIWSVDGYVTEKGFNP